MVRTVVLTRQVQKQLQKLPRHVVVKLQAWVEAVETEGLEAVRKMPGFHDEPLKGKRQGQRSIRLSHAYRGIYTVKSKGEVGVVRVEEVTKHVY